MNSRLQRLIPACLLALVAGCFAARGAKIDDRHPQGRITITGSSTLAPMISELGKRFRQQFPGIRVEVQTGGSARGITDVRAGLADVGMVSRALKADEHDLQPVTVARDGVCLVLHADNPVSALNEEQIVAVYTGKITRWNQLGGQDRPITVISKAEGRSTLEVFLEHFHLKSRDIDADVIVGDNSQVIKLVTGNPDAVGYVSVGTAEYEAQHGAPIQRLPLAGVPATVQNVTRGAYPLARDLILITAQTPAPLARQFIEFALSPAARPVLEEFRFAPPS